MEAEGPVGGCYRRHGLEEERRWFGERSGSEARERWMDRSSVLKAEATRPSESFSVEGSRKERIKDDASFSDWMAIPSYQGGENQEGRGRRF